MFVVPLHPAVYLGVLVYNYYYGVIDHSGIYLRAVWPWQPSSMFHDDHHKYFHCNFGVNTKLFDWIHGTLRQPDRYYSEATFGGKGALKS
ncbi:lathosterol oxidase-like [Saccoglossus kowalevskii]